MNQRLSKLAEYLQEGKYEMAVSQFSEHPETLSEVNMLELVRAYFYIEDHNKALEFLSPLSCSANPAVFYESKIIQVKVRYLLGLQAISTLNQTISHVKRHPNIFQSHHLIVLTELQSIINNSQIFSERLSKQTDRQLQNQNTKFSKLLEQEEFDNPLQDGFPMYLISQLWLQKWKKYVKRQHNFPGPITHFQIMDHRFNSLWDPTPQKRYTNYFLYPSVKVRALPKACWTFLKEKYGGFDFKRYNVWVNGRPKQIITEIYLKKLSLKFENQMKIYEILISKKQSLAGVIKKLNAIWGQGGIFTEEKGELKPVDNLNDGLEQIDTTDKVYIFSEKQLHKRQNGVQNKLEKCPVCKKMLPLKFCQCKSIKYCSINCLKEDRDKHHKKCEIQMAYKKQQSASAATFQLVEKAYGGRKGLVGLRNLGNTCYMNSGLQCMSNTKEITEYFMTNKFLSEINNNNPLGTKGHLACSYAELIRSMWTSSDGAISPFTLKKVIGKFAAQFSGYGQQDSQEFISYLIDGLQEDLNLVKKKETFQVNDEPMPDDQASKISEINYSKRIRSYIRDLMAGQFKSTVICSICEKKSICFDPYLLITLQIPSVFSENQLYFVPLDAIKSTAKKWVLFDHNTKVGVLRKELQNHFADQNTFIVLREVSLDTMDVLRTLKDDQSLFKAFQRLKQAESGSILAYETKMPDQREKLHKIDYFYGKNKIGYPRFINLPLSATPQQVGQAIWPAIEKYSRTAKRGFKEDYNKIFRECPKIDGSGVVQARLLENIGMLKCRTQQSKLRLYGDKMLTLSHCLSKFTQTQILQNHNEWYCNKCKKFVKASKKMQIYKSNKILVMAFKRFNRGRKIKNFIDFPIQELDMGPYILKNTNNEKIIYDLYGIVNHYGSLGGGHYTAYCKNFLNNNWYEFDDSRICEVRPKEVVSESAYVVFYRRRN